MTDFVRLVLPLFGIILIGYAAGRIRPISTAGRSVLERVLLQLALPALLFRLVAETPIAVLDDAPFFLTVAFATYCTFAIAFTVAALRNGGDIPDATISGLVGANGRAATMAPALTLPAFGAAAGAPTAIILALDVVLLLSLGPLLLAVGAERGSFAAVATRIARRIALDPSVLAVAAGILYSAAGLELPQGINDLLAVLGGAAAPLGLLLLGLVLARQSQIEVTADMLPALCTKLFIHPLIVYLLLGWVGNFDPAWVYSAVLIAALPPAGQAVSVAARSVSSRIVSAANAGLIGSVVTLAALIALVSSGTLPADPFP